MHVHPVIRGLAAILVLVTSGVLAGCGPAEPAPATTAGSAEAPVGVSSAPGPGDPTPVAGASAGPGVTVIAQDIAFQPQAVTVTAGVPFTLILDNRDDGIPHNVAVKGQDGTTIAKSEIVTGPARTALVMAPLTAGSYAFTCEVHPNMTGTITVTP